MGTGRPWAVVVHGRWLCMDAGCAWTLAVNMAVVVVMNAVVMNAMVMNGCGGDMARMALQTFALQSGGQRVLWVASEPFAVTVAEARGLLQTYDLRQQMPVGSTWLPTREVRFGSVRFGAHGAAWGAWLALSCLICFCVSWCAWGWICLTKTGRVPFFVSRLKSNVDCAWASMRLPCHVRRSWDGHCTPGCRPR